MADLSVRIGGLTLKNSVIAASGTFGFGEEYGDLYDVSRLGAICTKGLTLRPREGNPTPRLWETPCGLLNSIGLQNPGINAFLEEELPRMKAQEIVTIANVWGETQAEYVEMVERLSGSAVDAIELNLSCPNVPGEMLGQQAEETGQVVRAARKVSRKPLWVKLSPDARVEVAQAAEQAGTDAVCAVNTFRAMAIDIETGKSVFERVFAGLSGPAIRPIALRIVHELVTALDIPVIGIGGITTWQDAVAFIMAGASAIQVGTANFIDPWSAIRIVEGLEEFMQHRGLSNWEEIRGCAH
jgi:dihydroorotate dehydrogenase (NAD+) catalytic subunit